MKENCLFHSHMRTPTNTNVIISCNSFKRSPWKQRERKQKYRSVVVSCDVSDGEFRFSLKRHFRLSVSRLQTTNRAALISELIKNS